MKIAFLTPLGTIGGAERVLLNLLDGIRTLEPEWKLKVIVSSGGDLADEVAKLGVECAVVPFPPAIAQLGDATRLGWRERLSLNMRVARAVPSIVRYANRLRKCLAQFEPDVVHTNGLKMHAFGAFAKPSASSLVWHMHDYVSSRRIMAPVLRLISGRCALSIAISESVAADLRATCGSRLAIRTILNGVDLTEFSPDGPKMDLDGLCGSRTHESKVVRVGLVATSAAWKGHSVFLRAIALVDSAIPLAAYIVGGPIYSTATEQQDEASLSEQANSLGIHDRVFFTGHIKEVASVMRALDIVVHASTSAEPFGLVIIEAMASGRPVIVSPLGGAAEIAGDGAFALCAAPGDAVMLARQISRLALDSDLRQSMGWRGRIEAERRFDAREVAKSFVRAYRVRPRFVP